MYKRRQTSVKRHSFPLRSAWKIGREPVHIELGADLWEKLEQNAGLLGMDIEEYASYVLSIQVTRETLKRMLCRGAIEAIDEAFGLSFYGMPQSHGGLLRMDRMLVSALDYLSDNPHATIMELLGAMHPASLN